MTSFVEDPKPVPSSQTSSLNSILSVQDSKDAEISKLFAKLDELSSCLDDESVSNTTKYEQVVSFEYILVKLRIQVETEHINIKRILASSDVPALLRATFQRRDQYLAQVCLKLNSLREDIAVLQKVVYTNSNFIKK